MKAGLTKGGGEEPSGLWGLNPLAVVVSEADVKAFSRAGLGDGGRPGGGSSAEEEEEEEEDEGEDEGLPDEPGIAHCNCACLSL